LCCWHAAADIMLRFHLLHLEGKVVTKGILSPNRGSETAERDGMNTGLGDVRSKGIIPHVGMVGMGWGWTG